MKPEDLKQIYINSVLDLEEKAHGKLAADEAAFSNMMGEGYRDPNYPKRLADPEFSDVAEILNQLALSPPPKNYPGKISGRVLGSKELGLPVSSEGTYYVAPPDPMSSLGVTTVGSYMGDYSTFRSPFERHDSLGKPYPKDKSLPPDRIQYRKDLKSVDSEGELDNTIKHEFIHRVQNRSGYKKLADERFRLYVPEDNAWRKLQRSTGKRITTPINESMAYGYAHKLRGGELDDPLVRRDLRRLLRGYVPKGDDLDKYVEDMIKTLPSMVNDFEKYLQEQEELNPTLISRIAEIENELE